MRQKAFDKEERIRELLGVIERKGKEVQSLKDKVESWREDRESADAKIAEQALKIEELEAALLTRPEEQNAVE